MRWNFQELTFFSDGIFFSGIYTFLFAVALLNIDISYPNLQFE
jgi:hypothetical protein